MSDRDRFVDLPILHELRDQLEARFDSAEEHARRPRLWSRRPGWPRGRNRLVVVLAVLLITGGTAFAAVSLTGQRSAPLSGVVPPSTSGSSWQRSLAGSRYDIELVPSLEAGKIGWCASLVYSRPGFGFGQGTCPTSTPAVGAPLFAPDGSSGPGLWYVLAAPNVAAVRIAGSRTILTRADPRLPYGFRAAVVDLPTALHGPLPRLTALDAGGHAIPGDASTYPAASPTRHWSPSRRAVGRCSIGVRPGSGVRALGGTVVTTIVPDPGIVGHAFLPCVNARVTLDDAPGARLLAALLLDAKRPGADLAPLPDMRPVDGHPGILDRPSPLGKPDGRPGSPWGGFTARRVGNAWLVVEGATLAGRIQALNALTVGPVDARGPRGPLPPARGALCSIGVRPLAGLREVSQVAYPGARQVTRSGPPDLTSCSGADFYFRDQTLHAMALVPVGRPGVPPTLKGARPVPGHADMLTVSSPSGPRYDTIWRRAAGAWLTVNGNATASQRATILAHLTLSRRPR